MTIDGRARLAAGGRGRSVAAHSTPDMASRKQPCELEAMLAALRRARADLPADSARTEVRRALGGRHWLVVAEAAKLVGELTLEGYEQELRGVWPRFRENAAKADPGCRAKEAALTALDLLEVLDPAPFLDAIRYRQLEPAHGGSVDTAGGVRQRALLALFRLCHPDAPAYAGELFADPDPNVRAGAARAVGHYGDRSSAGLLLYKLRVPDPDAEVATECAAALLAVAPDFAVPLLREALEARSEAARESAALVLGQSRCREALDVLLAWTRESVHERDFRLGARALSVSRDERAREFLLAQVASASAPRARFVADTLRDHDYDEALQRRVAESLALNPRLRDQR